MIFTNNAKYEKIRDFLLTWGYKPEDVAAYVKRTAPELTKGNGQAARHEAMNGLLNAILGREQAQREPVRINRPEVEKGFDYDLFVILGLSDDPITVNDLADYTQERLSRIDAERQRKAGADKMSMSNALRGLNRAEDDARREAVADALWERSERLYSDTRSMNEVIATLPALDAQKITFVDPPK